jgi:hypothetical protein
VNPTSAHRDDWKDSPRGSQRISPEQNTEAWRKFHAEQLERQGKAIESIRTYVAIWFWLSIASAVLIFFAAST